MKDGEDNDGKTLDTHCMLLNVDKKKFCYIKRKNLKSTSRMGIKQYIKARR